jgi:hypothetical protein
MRGEVACHDHVPPDPRWSMEGWVPLPPTQQGRDGIQYLCQHCSLVGIAFIRPEAPKPE